MRLRKLTLAIGLTLAAATLASCTSSTPQSRIEKDPSRYGRLSSADKALVDQGNIKSGMTTDAVYLAWGRPASVARGGSGNASTERWTYSGQTPVWTNSFSVGYGGGYGRYCGGYYDYGPTITYVPYTAGIVHFTNGRVTKWEQSGR